MKKLMIAAAIVCAAAYSQAANYVWSTSKGANIFLMNSTDKLDQQNAYLFLAADAATVFSAWNNGEKSLADITGILDTTKTTSAGMVTSKSDAPISIGGDALNAIIATETTIDGTKYLFISGVASAASESLGAGSLQFKTDQMGAAKNAASKWADGYAGAGWYSAAAVPEPTSGLLLLLGVAGLALRRRRA